jgi:phage protein D
MANVISGIDIYAPVFIVKLVKSGKTIPKDSISSIEVEENLDSPAMFTISLSDTLNIDTQKFKWLDDASITPGTEVTVNFGYASLPEKQGLIRGRIKGINPNFLSTGGSTLAINGYDLSHDMQKKEGKLSYKDVTYSEVAEDIAKNNSLKSNGVEPTRKKHNIVERKKNEKDYGFIKRLAEDIGFEFFVRDTILYFREPKDREKGKMTFELRKNFISFNPRMATANLVNEVKVSAWNDKDKEQILETAKISDIKSGVGVSDLDNIIEKSQNKKIRINLEGRVVKSREEAKTLAITELKRRNNGFIEGSLECAGDPQLRPGMTVNILKVGDRFSGVYYVKTAKHSIGDGGYGTTLEVRRSL